MRTLVQLSAPWADAESVIHAFRDEPWAVCLSSGPRWTFLARDPSATLSRAAEAGPAAFDQLRALLGPPTPPKPGLPPFCGGVVALASYDLGEAMEGVARAGDTAWPGLAAARYDAVLAFDRIDLKLVAVGAGSTEAHARRRAEAALGWLDQAAPGGSDRGALGDLRADDPFAYEAAVADVVDRIGTGEIFQANIARAWVGRLDGQAHPADLFARLAGDSPAPFAAYLRLPGLALVSNSPERFLRVEGGWAESQPIKGTRPRGRDSAEDRALARDLETSVKDRAENLMIVDLMRNDLARACAPGSVSVPGLLEPRSYANVHHLVSTVRGRLRPGADAVDLLRAAFPPGSVTGAPKIQAMRVIARHEAPRGPYCGSLLWLGYDGAMDSNVLIRTLACAEDRSGWRIEARAGAGIVADSRPGDERRETEAKISAIAAAVTGERS